MAGASYANASNVPVTSSAPVGFAPLTGLPTTAAIPNSVTPAVAVQSPATTAVQTKTTPTALGDIQAGQTFTDANGNQGVAKYDPMTGKPYATIAPPSTSSDGAVSSNDMTTGQSQQQASTAAAGALTGAGAGAGGTLAPWQQTILTGMQSTDDNYKALNAQLFQSINDSYDANLAQTNAQYADLYNQLATQHTTDVQAGTARAVSLNPYSQDKQASTAAGYTSTLNTQYQTQYNSLTAKLQAAQQALAAGKTDAYNTLSKQAADEAADFQKNMSSFVTNSIQMQQSQSNSDRTYNLGVAEKGQSDFNTLLTQLSGSPQVQSEIDAYEKTGKVTAGLQPIVDKGLQAGMSPTEALSVFSYQSQAARNQQALENYRDDQQILSQERIANAQINANVKIATMQGLQQTSAALIASGKQPGTLDYATGLANATVGSKQTLPSTSVGTYTNIGILASQLDGLKSGIQSIDQNSDAWNIINSYAGQTASSMTDANLSVVNSKIQALSGILGKSVFGESGNLSNSDISRVLGNLPTGKTSSDVRDALYNNITQLLAQKAVITLQNDASNGYNVSAYAPTVQSIVEKANASGLNNGSASTGSTYKGFTLPF